MTMPPVVALESVTRCFRGVTVLDSISLEAGAGEAVAIYGRSGSGKTTLLNLAGGLDRPDSGTVRVGGVALEGLSPVGLSDLRRTKMAFIFQSYGLLSHLSALENVAFGLRLAGHPRREWHERTAAALDAVGLTGRARNLPAQLSGGERQRVAVARALAAQPSLVLADEPTGALDHGTGLAIADLLVAYARETGASVWIATHDAGIAQFVDRVYRISGGHLQIEVKR